MKKFLSTAAVALVMGTGAYAAGHGNALLEMEFDAESNLYASELIGMRVYATEDDAGERTAEIDDNWDDIGEIDDVVLTRDGNVAAVIVGVGGFLGIGEKDVAIDMNQLKWVADEDDEGDYFLVVNTTQEMLEQTAGYERHDRNMNEDTAAVDGTTQMESSEETAEAKDIDGMTPKESEETAERMTSTDVIEGAGTGGDGEVENTEMASNDMDNDRTMLTAPDIAVDGFKRADFAELTSENLTGARVYGANGEDVGEVSELILSDDGKIERVVLDIGGFLGLGEHQVAVTYDELNIQRADGGDDFRVYIDATEEALEAQPEYEG